MKTQVPINAIGPSVLDGLLRAILHWPVGVLAIVAVLSTNSKAQPALEAPFTRITNGVIGAVLAMSVPAAWGDYDNDGWLDLFVGN